MGDDAENRLGTLFTACEVTKDPHNCGLSDSLRLIDLSSTMTWNSDLSGYCDLGQTEPLRPRAHARGHHLRCRNDVFAGNG